MQTPPMGFVDVRDVTAAQVAGIKTPGRNRVLLAGEWFEVKDAVDHIAVARPELADRLTNAVIDNTRAVEVLGVQVISWKEMIVDTIDSLVKLEKEWQEAGVDVETTLKKSFWRA